jgi:prevent-host-death family protein
MPSTAEKVWQAAKARESFAELVEGALAGTPQVVRRRDGKEVVVVSREHYERTKPSLKSYLLTQGHAGEEEDAFDRAMRDIREGAPIPFGPRDADLGD